MCGIAGLLYKTDNRSAEEEILFNMRDSMVHRGPDEAGIFVDGSLGLVHRRLSILDVSHGHQPMSTYDGRYTIVFNGEIYNFMQLRKELENEGVTFKTTCDTEVILHLIALHGPDAVHRLNGIFAYAIWDQLRKRLTIARDRMGIKPLYYVNNDQGFAFASEIKALFESDIVRAKLNKKNIPEYFLFHHVAGEENLFEGIYTLLPGHTLTIESNNIHIKPYWLLADDRQPKLATNFEAAANELDNVLTQAIRSQMISDVPLGTFCSGGIDSSLVTAIAAQSTSQTINTFSVGFDEAEYDETKYARMVANQYQTNHHEIILDPDEFVDLLPKLIWQSDLPLNFTNSVHIYAISKLAKQSVTVVLTGEGADELFGGYPRYYIPRIVQRLLYLPSPLRRVFTSLFSRLPDHRAKKLAYYATQNLADTLLYNPTHSDRNLIRLLYNLEWPQKFTYRENIISAGNKRGLDPVSNMALLDQHTYLISILNRQDKMSMGASVEARVPFLDNNVLTFSESLPLEYKQTAMHRKRILKSVARRYLPADVIDRPKSGFGVPIGQWMRGNGALSHCVKTLIEDGNLTEFFDKNALKAVVDAHQKGEVDHSDFLWSAINFSLWRKQFNV